MSDTSTTNPPAPAPTPTPPPAPAPDASKTETPPDAAKKFTQADLDRVVSERLARQKAQFADYDDAKAKAAKFDEVDAASKSDLEKAQARAEKAEKAAADALARAELTARKAAVLAEATKAGAVDAETVAQLVDSSAITVAGDGSVTGAAEAVKALLEARPFLLASAAGTKPTPGFDGGARPGASGVTADQLRSMTPRQIADLDPKVVDAALKAG